MRDLPANTPPQTKPYRYTCVTTGTGCQVEKATRVESKTMEVLREDQLDGGSITRDTSSRIRPNVDARSFRSSLTCLETNSLCVISSPASNRAYMYRHTSTHIYTLVKIESAVHIGFINNYKQLALTVLCLQHNSTSPAVFRGKIEDKFIVISRNIGLVI